MSLSSGMRLAMITVIFSYKVIYKFDCKSEVQYIYIYIYIFFFFSLQNITISKVVFMQNAK